MYWASPLSSTRRISKRYFQFWPKGQTAAAEEWKIRLRLCLQECGIILLLRVPAASNIYYNILCSRSLPAHDTKDRWRERSTKSNRKGCKKDLNPVHWLTCQVHSNLLGWRVLSGWCSFQCNGVHRKHPYGGLYPRNKKQRKERCGPPGAKNL